ncbi:MAG: type I-U CRISPR-associated protein Csb2 [Actinomycetota bacterium]|jgi:CRISPR-associated protein Csb2|nr:type I-U CRISPR-associated protein Csb2 [Actinomycetota bacterium]
MLTVSVELLHGTIRAGSPDDTVLAGGEPSGEWPPSPARLFSALVAADGTGARCTVTTGEELAWLETLEPPIILASGHEEVLRSPMRDRYAVLNERAEGAVQEYPARKAKEIRQGVRQAPKDPTVTYVWPDAQPSADHLAALALRAARIGYVGCADSPVRVTVTEETRATGTIAWRPDAAGTDTLPVAFPGFLDALDRLFAAWSAGQPTRRSWVTTRRARYQPPISFDEQVVSSTRQVIWLRLERALSGRRLLVLTESLKAAVLDHVQRLAPERELPAILHGHRQPDERGSQADFLGLLDVGRPRATGRIMGAAISLPADAEPDLLQLVRTAVARLSVNELVGPVGAPESAIGFRVKLRLHGGERRPWASVPWRWVRPARAWVSATPVVHERWSKRAPDVEEVARWCTHAGIPNDAHLVDARFFRHPLVEGALDLPSELVFRAKQERRPYSHMMLVFDRPVGGPIVLGRSRQYGFGLFVPAVGPIAT